MLSSIYYGEIQSDKLVSWNENKDPYNILVENNRVYKLGGWEFLDIANKLFRLSGKLDRLKNHILPSRGMFFL